MKICQIYASRMEEGDNYKVTRIEEYPIPKYFQYVFRDIWGLSPKMDIVFSINLMHGAAPVSKTPYRMNTPKLKDLQMHFEEILKKGYICPSVSPWGSPMLFVNKKNVNLRFCIDLRQLNKVSVKNKYHFPRINDVFYQQKDANIFSNIDFKSSYHQVRIKEEYIIKMTFRTRYDHYEFKVVPFGLSNEPAIFMCLMNGIFINYLDKVVIIILYDILIYSNSK
jgi:hypothetical protein